MYGYVVDFQTWMAAVQSSLTATGHGTPASAYVLSHLASLHQSGVSPVIAARQIAAGQVPLNPPAPPVTLIQTPYSVVSGFARMRIEFARRFCVLAGWIIWGIGALYVFGGLLLVVIGAASQMSSVAILGVLFALSPTVAGLLIMGVGGVLLVIGYGTRLLLDIHEKILTA